MPYVVKSALKLKTANPAPIELPVYSGGGEKAA